MAVTQQGPGNAPYEKASGITTGNTIRVVLADDSPGTSGGSGTLTANLTQIKGVAVSTGNGATDTGTVRVTIATDTPLTLDADAINLNTDTLEALGTTGNTNTSAISGKLPATLGQKASAASMAVVVASDQSAIPASQSGTWNVTNVSGTVSLPTGASTSALQTTGNTSVSSIDGKLGSLGQKNMAGSAPVVLASDQAAIPVTSTTSSVVPGTGSTNLGKAEDAASVSGDTGVLSLAVRNDTGATLTSTDLDYGAITVDAAGRSIVTLGTLISGEDQTNNVLKTEQRFSFLNITTNATTTVKSGAGFLHRVTVGTIGTTSSVIIYDNTAGSGTIISTMSSVGQTSLEFNAVFSTGLTLVTSGAAAANLTVSYR